MLRLYLCEKIIVNTARQKRDFFDEYLQVRAISPKNSRVNTLQISAV